MVKGDRMKTARLMAAAVLVFGSVLAIRVARAQQPELNRTDLQRHDLSIPGREVIQARVDFSPGAAAPRHSHPGEEVVYAIEGSMEYQLDGKPPMRIKAGEVLFVPAGTIHSAKNVGSDNAAVLATFIVEKGKPFLVMSR
jgi:quercetin dioxygenase-like cupin family protein